METTLRDFAVLICYCTLKAAVKERPGGDSNLDLWDTGAQGGLDFNNEDYKV